MATVRTAPAPAPQFPIVAPPLPVQNGAQTGSKVRRHVADTTQNIFPSWVLPPSQLVSLQLSSADTDHPDRTHAGGPAPAASRWRRPSCWHLSCDHGHSSRRGSRISSISGCAAATCTHQVQSQLIFILCTLTVFSAR